MTNLFFLYEKFKKQGFALLFNCFYIYIMLRHIKKDGDEAVLVW